MQRLDILRREVEKLYTANNPAADVWIDWAYENHVLFVADYAERLAKRHNANVEFVIAGALLHDIADVIMDRDLPGHEEESLALAEKLLTESGFNEDERETIVHDIIEPHSCSDKLPQILEGKIVATADGASHFITDFYPLFCWRHYGPQDDYQVFKNWMLGKMEKDFVKKLFFDEVKQEVLPRYEALKLVFS